MILNYKGKAKYMKGFKEVKVEEEYTIGKSYSFYLFRVNGKRYAVSKKTC